MTLFIRCIVNAVLIGVALYLIKAHAHTAGMQVLWMVIAGITIGIISGMAEVALRRSHRAHESPGKENKR